MTNFVKLALAATAMTVAAPAFADDIVVQTKPQMDQWSARVTSELNSALEKAEWHNGASKPGIVQLRFTVDQNGKAEDISVMRSSGNDRTDDNAITAVSLLDSLGDAPVSSVANRTFQANIVFARNDLQKVNFVKELRQSERDRMARGDAEEVILIGG